MDDLQFYVLFSLPGWSPGRAIVLPPASTLALVLAKCWSFYVKVFYVTGQGAVRWAILPPWKVLFTVFYILFKSISLGHMAQSVVCLTQEPEGLGSINQRKGKRKYVSGLGIYPVRQHTFVSPSADSRGAVVSYLQKHEHLSTGKLLMRSKPVQE